MGRNFIHAAANGVFGQKVLEAGRMSTQFDQTSARGQPAGLSDQTDSRAAFSNVGRIASGSGRIV